MMGGEFATARRGYDEGALAYAQTLFDRGMSYQGISMATGISVESLKPVVKRKPVVRLELPDPAPVICDETVVSQVARKYGLTVGELVSQSAARRVAWPRMEAYYELHRRGLSFPTVARITRRGDHTTVIAGIAKHKARLAWAEVLTVFAAFNKSGPSTEYRSSPLLQGAGNLPQASERVETPTHEGSQARFPQTCPQLYPRGRDAGEGVASTGRRLEAAE